MARTYRLGRRQEAVNRTKARVIGGARRLLKSRDAAKGFSMEAVARYAGVTRATVYHQFRSKTGLLNALYDHLAARAKLRDHLQTAFRQPRARAGIASMISAYCRFWANDRLVIRRLHALADLDRSFSRADRQEWRRDAIQSMLRRLGASRASSAQRFDDCVDSLHTLTSFETFDSVARASRGNRAVTALVIKMADRILAPLLYSRTVKKS